LAKGIWPAGYPTKSILVSGEFLVSANVEGETMKGGEGAVRSGD
jgi:hypothetical protein